MLYLAGKLARKHRAPILIAVGAILMMGGTAL